MTEKRHAIKLTAAQLGLVMSALEAHEYYLHDKYQHDFAPDELAEAQALTRETIEYVSAVAYDSLTRPTNPQSD